MSLRSRLTLFFVAIVVLPVTAVTISSWRAVAGAADRQVRNELEFARRSATLLFAAQIKQATDLVNALATERAFGRSVAPADPLLPMPDRITPAARSRWSAASERKKSSTGRPWRGFSSCAPRCRWPLRRVRVWPGRIT